MPDRDVDADEVVRAVTVRLTWQVLDGDTAVEEGSTDVVVQQAPPVAGDRVEVRIETDAATAAELRTGALSAQHALLLGRLTLHGEVALLPALAEAIGEAGA